MVTKLYRQNNGLNLIIGIESANEENIIERYYSFWNHGATEGELHWLIESKFAYIRTDTERFRKAMINGCLFEILNKLPDKDKGKKTGSIEEARKLADKRIAEIEDREMIGPSQFTEYYEFTLGEIEHKAPDYLIKRRQSKISVDS